LGEVYRLIKNGDLIRYVHGIPNHLTFSGCPKKKNTPKKQKQKVVGEMEERERERERELKKKMNRGRRKVRREIGRQNGTHNI